MIDRVDQIFAKVIWVVGQTSRRQRVRKPNTTPNTHVGGPTPNTPYRKFKSTDYEGGIRTPFIAHWPGVIKPGMTDQVAIIDVSATFRDITGDTQGKSTVTKTERALKNAQELYWHFNRANAVRQGDLKRPRRQDLGNSTTSPTPPRRTISLKKGRKQGTRLPLGSLEPDQPTKQ